MVVVALQGSERLAEALGPEAVVAALDALAGSLGLADARPEGDAIAGLADDAGAALEAAFRAESAGREVLAAARGARHLHVAVGIGLGLGDLLVRADGAWGAEASRARRLAAFRGGGGVACTEAFFAAGPIPEGVGAFRAPEVDEKRLGAPFRELRDFRC